MSNLSDDLEKIKNPDNIHEALFASGPNGLMKAFERNPIVNRIIKYGSKAVPLIEKILKEEGDQLHEISLSCFAFILENVDIKAAAKILIPHFTQAMKDPEPFFVHFAAQVLRRQFRLPYKPRDPYYSRGELLETLDMVKRRRV